MLVDSQKATKPTSQKYFNEKFDLLCTDWEKIYLLPRLVTKNTYLRSFQYKILNNILYLNKKLFIFGLKASPLCSFCQEDEETTIHLFSNCDNPRRLWLQIKVHFSHFIDLPLLTPQSAIFGFVNANKNEFLFLNFILLLFKLYVYRSRDSKKLYFSAFIRKVKHLKLLEQKLVKMMKTKEDCLIKNGALHLITFNWFFFIIIIYFFFL